MFSFIGHLFSVAYNGVFYRPLYNGLVFLIGFIPHGDVGAAIILFTILIRFVLYPLSKKSLESQRKMKELGPQMEQIKIDFKDNKDEQAKRTLALYKENKINPFSGILFMFIQLPIVIALYQVFRGDLSKAMIDLNLLYSFIHTPSVINLHFLGFLDITHTKNIVLALLAAASQFFQAKYTLSATTPSKVPSDPNKKASFQDEFSKGMSLQMKYMLPAMIGIFAYGFSGAVTLYWITNNLFSIVQELLIKKK
ncbi:MAG: YidC/Oxa1 family membrane protein insertase [Candidatus Pacebacteria bacterium]|nr:YidC/Oxa1 family membrane protein insertase [Candidatus Paceibacterota bacterium]MDD5356827.1 YidC/Oxa1 family membrane protein insertase [Candidatus Paceibacterota bacterium]